MDSLSDVLFDVDTCINGYKISDDQLIVKGAFKAERDETDKGKEGFSYQWR